MPYLVRFHGVENATMKAREDRVIEHPAHFFDIADETLRDDEVGGLSLHKVCGECGHSELVGQVRTERMKKGASRS